MGEVELKNTLQREAELQVREVWHAAEACIEQRRQELADERDRLGELAHERRAEELATLRQTTLFEARQRIRTKSLHVSQILAERLLSLARTEVKNMALAGGEALFRDLVRELPEMEWSGVIITPESKVRTDSYFPAAIVREDPALLGGFIAEARDGRVRIDNSLAGRLTRFWPELLATMLTELESEVNHAVTCSGQKP